MPRRLGKIQRTRTFSYALVAVPIISLRPESLIAHGGQIADRAAAPDQTSHLPAVVA